MMETEECIDECVEILLKAEEIRNDAELMKQVEPAMKAKIASMKKFIDLKDMRKLASDKALEEQKAAEEIQSDYFSEGVVLGEKPDSNKITIPGKV